MRSFKSKATLASLIGLLAMLVAACGASSSSTPLPTGNGVFKYSYTNPAKKGGQVVIGDWQSPDVLNPLLTQSSVTIEVLPFIFNSCLVQLPDLSLGSDGFRPDQCTKVPSLANGDESADGKTTKVHIDPKAKWSDGTNIKMEDWLFFLNMAKDPNISGAAPFDQIDSFKKIDDTTFSINWMKPYAAYQNFVSGLQPFPLHVYASAKVYDPATDKYDSTAAVALSTQDNFGTNPPVVNGAFTTQSFAPDGATFVKNPNFYSNFFKGPNLDKVIFKSSGDKDVLIQSYKANDTYDKVEDFTIADLPKFVGIDASEQRFSPQIFFEHNEFNQRPQAPSAKLNGGTSPFTDANVRLAFIKAFDRCTMITTLLGLKDCNDPSIATNEFTAPPAFDFSSDVKFPTFDGKAAADLLTAAGYPLVGGVRMMKDGKTPFVVNYATTKGNTLRANVEAFQAQGWKNALGVTTTLNTYPAGTGLFALYAKGGILATGAYDIALFAYQNPSDPGAGLRSTLDGTQVPSATAAAGQNNAGINDPTVQSALDKGDVELDPAKRKQIYIDLQKYVAAQSFFIPLYIRANYTLAKASLGNYTLNPTSAGNDWSGPDWFTTK